MGKDKKNNEGDILFPERTLTLNGEKVEVREFTFREEMQAIMVAEEIIADLANLYKSEKEPSFQKIEKLFATHEAAFFELVSLSTGKSVEWLQALPGREGHVLLMTFWSVNSHFFIQRVVMETLATMPTLAEKIASTSGNSSPSSSSTATSETS